MARRLVEIAATLIVALVLCGFSNRPTDRIKVLRVKDRAVISFAAMLGELRTSRVIIVGEIHDRRQDHDLELRLITELKKQETPIALALEMFSADRQETLDSWVAKEIPLQDFIRIYYEEWRMPWPNYSSIFLYAQQEQIPLVGLNAPASIMDKVNRSGFSALTAEERLRLPDGVSCSIDASYRKFIAWAYRQHRSEKSFLYFCEAQMLWNKAMAWHLAAYLQKFPRTTVVVLTGVGHAVKQAIPTELAEYLPVPVSVVMAESPELSPKRVTRRETDYLVLL